MLMFFESVPVSLTTKCNRSTEVHRDRAILNTCTVCFSYDVFKKCIKHGAKKNWGILISQIFSVVSIV